MVLNKIKNINKFRIIKLVSILVLFIMSCGFVVADLDLDIQSKLKENTLFIEPKVLAKLENQTQTRVIIKLKDKYKLPILKNKEEKREAINSLMESVNEIQSETLSKLPKLDFQLKRRLRLTNIVSGYITKEGLDKLRKDPNVEYIIASEKIGYGALPQSRGVIQSKQVNNILDNMGEGEVVCVVDSGIAYNHSYLGDCDVTGNINDRSCDKVIGGYDFVDDDTDPMDELGHGTHVAGIVAADGYIKGVAPKAELVAVRVIDENDSALPEDIAAGVEWCYLNASELDISVSVITMSLLVGTTTYNSPCGNLYGIVSNINEARNLYDIPVFVCSGNLGKTDGVTRPACASGAVSVGATYDENKPPRRPLIGNFSDYYKNFANCYDDDPRKDDISCFTDRGDNSLDLLAPGIYITSTDIVSITNDRAGTSMATPHAAGAAALIIHNQKKKNKAYTPDIIEDALKSTGKQIYDSKTDANYPRINVYEAIKYVDLFDNYLSIPNSTQAKISEGQTWQATMYVKNKKNKYISVEVRGATDSEVELIVKDPSNNVYNSSKVWYSSKNPERLIFSDPEDGTWYVNVTGIKVEDPYTEFTVVTEVYQNTTNTPGGINFSDIRVNFVANCNPKTQGGLTVNLRATKAGEDEVILDTAGKSSLATDAFLAGLVIPNWEQWIGMYIDVRNGYAYGDARYGGRFGQTEAGQRLFAMDEKLKWDFINKTHPVYVDMMGEWKDIVNSSPHYNKWMAAGFNGFPVANLVAEIIPDTFTINGSSCGDMYVEDVNLKINLEVSVFLANRSGLLGIEWASMAELLEEWKDEFESEIESYRVDAENKINNDGNYSDLRRIYASIATARWYKDEVPRHTSMFGDLMDSNDLEAVNIAVSDNKTYWDDQSLQYLFNFSYPSFRPWEKYHSWFLHGGVKFIYLFDTNLGDLSNYTLELMDNATIYEFASDDNNETVYYSSFLQPNKQDLAPISLWFNNVEPDLGEPVNITVTVENKGPVDTGLFDVYLATKFTFPNGYKSSDFIKAIYDNPSLSHGNVTHVSWVWTPTRLGINNISAEAWPYLGEINRHNNIITETIEVKDPYPTATIDAPLNYENFLYDDNITFIGSGYDSKDGSLDDTSLNWTSDVDGWLGTGSVIYNNLSLGKHIITLSVNDSDGHISTSQVIVSVTPSKPPTARILSPIDGSTVSEADRVYFEGEAIDTEDGLLGNYSLEWNSSIDGFLDYGNSFSTTGLSPGQNTIFLTATDSTNVKTTVYHNLTIEAAYPSVLTFSPQNGSEYYYNQDPDFEAEAVDPQEGNITSKLIWTSIIDGVIGYGSDFTHSLSAGMHRITALVIDQTGFTAEQEINLTVYPPLAPEASIITPRRWQTFTHGDIVYLRKAVNDPETGIIANTSIEWNVTGLYLGNGSLASVNTSSWSGIGNRTIRLSAYDPDDMYSSTYTNITITSALPVISILSPTAGQIFEENTNINFNADVNDLEDGNISSTAPNSIKWYSDLQGYINQGPSITTTLQKGTHRITAEVVDNDDINVTESINIMVAGIGEVQLNMLSTGETAKNLTYAGPANQTVFVRIHKNGNVTDAALTLQGHPK